MAVPLTNPSGENRFRNRKDSELLAYIFNNFSKERLEELNEEEVDCITGFAMNMLTVMREIENE